MKIFKVAEASKYVGVSINTLKNLSNDNKINSFKTTGGHRRFRQDDLDDYMGIKREQQEKLTVIYARCSTLKQKENLDIKIEIVETKEKKYEEELAEDIMKILTCYSARYYGARGGRKKKNVDFD